MYPVSQDYKNKIKENNRLFECKIQIEHSQGTLYLNDKDLVSGTLTYTESSQAGEEFTVGGAVASDISFTILNKQEYENIVFMGATVFVSIGLQVQEGTDAHFLQPSQPSKMQGYEEKWEYVPLGRFNIDDVNRQRNTIQIKAIDNMINLDKPYSLSKLSYPASLYQIYVNACNVCDIPVGTTNFPNKDYVVKIRPQDDLTFRDIIGYVAELAGCFAKCNRNGALELLWYKPTGLILEPFNRFNFKPSDDVVQIKGVMASVENTTYLAGSEDYAIDLTENPLLQGNYETVLPNILANVENTTFTPYTSDWQGNPTIQAGDMIKQIDRDGKEYNTLVTKSIYKYRGRSVLEGRGLPEISRGYKGSTNRKIAEIKRKIDVDIGDKLTTLEEQQLQATELIANMLGGYAIKTEEAFYIADNEDLNLAQKVWKWGIGGFGYSENGVDGPYTTAITADGSIVAMLVAANIITADMVQTGILQSEDGSLALNLNTGTFSFQKGIVQFTPNGLKVLHGSSNQYSEVRNDGFVRKWQYGESAYLNDIWVGNYSYASGITDYKPEPVEIVLPQRFQGRGNDVDVFLSISDLRLRIGNAFDIDRLTWITSDSNTVLRLVSSDFNLTNPKLYIDSYVNNIWMGRENNWRKEDSYNRLGFMIMVVGK